MEILTRRGQVILVDDDFHLAHLRWHLSLGYPETYINGEKTLMHHLILPKKEGFVRDHINGNRADNRRCNLRYVTAAQNMHNKAGWSSSGFKGVSWKKSEKKYVAQIAVNGKSIHLGCFTDPREASEVFELAVWLVRGEFGTTRHINDAAASKEE